jgi:hypothetical protein
MEEKRHETSDQASKCTVEVALVKGDKIEAQLGTDPRAARAELASLHAQLRDEVFLRIGEETIVRSEEVRWLRLSENDGQGLLDTLVTKVRGGNEMSSYEGHRTQQHNSQSGLAPWLGYGRRPYSETKPFFLTSEFLAFVGLLTALLITLGVSDSLNEFRGWLLPTLLTSAYILSRGIAKAGERDPNPEHHQGRHGGFAADEPLGRERQAEPYGATSGR